MLPYWCRDSADVDFCRLRQPPNFSSESISRGGRGGGGSGGGGYDCPYGCRAHQQTTAAAAAAASAAAAPGANDTTNSNSVGGVDANACDVVGRPAILFQQQRQQQQDCCHTNESADTDSEWYWLQEDRLQQTPVEERISYEHLLDEEASQARRLASMEFSTFATTFDSLSADSGDEACRRSFGSAATVYAAPAAMFYGGVQQQQLPPSSLWRSTVAASSSSPDPVRLSSRRRDADDDNTRHMGDCRPTCAAPPPPPPPPPPPLLPILLSKHNSTKQENHHEQEKEEKCSKMEAFKEAAEPLEAEPSKRLDAAVQTQNNNSNNNIDNKNNVPCSNPCAKEISDLNDLFNSLNVNNFVSISESTQQCGGGNRRGNKGRSVLNNSNNEAGRGRGSGGVGGVSVADGSDIICNSSAKGKPVASGRSLADIEAAVSRTRNNSNQQQRYEMRGGHAVEICSRVEFPDRGTRDVTVSVEATHSNGCHRVIMLKGLTAKKRPDLGPKVKDCRLRMDQIVLTRASTATEEWQKSITMSYDSDFQVGMGDDKNRPL